MGPKLERVKRERFLPFPFVAQGLGIKVDAVYLDGVPLASDPEDALVVEEEGWSTLRLCGSVHVRDGALAGLAPDERDAPFRFASRWLVLRCDQTHLRQGYRTEDDGSFELNVDRGHVQRAFTLTPHLVRRTAGRVQGYAEAPGSKLASGPRLTVRLYEPRPRSGNFLDISYVPFSEDIVLGRQPWRLYQLDARGERPVLRINRDHREAVRVLDARGQTGLSARLREVFYDQISRGVWGLLFVAAIESLDDEGRTRFSWQEGVLDELSPHLFPSTPKRARREALLQLRAEDGALFTLCELCDVALQHRLDIVKHMSRLVRETGVGE